MTLLLALLAGAWAADADGDGLRDPDNLCPTEPEDFDGLEDTDGCPDPDNDRDGVLDVEDRCPNDPGPAMGCPDVHPDTKVLTIANVDSTAVPMLHFASGDRHIPEDEAAALDQVALVIANHPGIRVSVQGHADDPGSAAHNQQLSEERARVVVAALVARGVDPARLEVLAYGNTRPIDTRKTAAGRAHNRRVEFAPAG